MSDIKSFEKNGIVKINIAGKWQITFSKKGKIGGTVKAPDGKNIRFTNKILVKDQKRQWQNIFKN